MGAYCDKTFYLEEYQGSLDLDASQMDRLLTHGSLLVDQATRFSIGSIEDKTEFIKRQVKMATCSMADYIHEQRGELAGILRVAGSYSIGDVSISGTSRPVDLHESGLTWDAYRYLIATGLMDRRIR